MQNKQEVAVTLSAENWKAIMEIIKLSCSSRRVEWVQWGKGVNQTIQSSIDTAFGADPAIQRVPVDSGKLNSIGYDPNSRILEIQYDNGDVYQYYQVPQAAYSSMMHAEFAFGYFNYNIKYKFKSKMIGLQPLLHSKQKRSYTFNENLDYDKEPTENYTLRDLKSDLGMDFMSDGEFDHWLDDTGSDRD